MSIPEKIYFDNKLFSSVYSMFEIDGGIYKERESLSNIKYIRADLVSEWLPIETAPKDGKTILAFLDSDICIVYWDKRYGSWREAGTHEFLEDYFTHWMPLPKPPRFES